MFVVDESSLLSFVDCVASLNSDTKFFVTVVAVSVELEVVFSEANYASMQR